MKKREGFWYSERESTYPMPVPNTLTFEEVKVVYDLIRQKEILCEKEIDGYFVEGYRGMSYSRITGETLGSIEYHTPEWIWPGDFAEHYVLFNKVKPTDEFLKYIGYE